MSKPKNIRTFIGKLKSLVDVYFTPSQIELFQTSETVA
jgi:hypothetical protein